MSSILMTILVFTDAISPEDDMGDLLGVDLALILTEVALMFVLPENQEMCTIERVLTFHTLSMIGITIMTAMGFGERSYLVAAVSGVLLLTAVFVLWEYSRYAALVRQIKDKLYAQGSQVGVFTEIDNII